MWSKNLKGLASYLKFQTNTYPSSDPETAYLLSGDISTDLISEFYPFKLCIRIGS